MRQILDSLPQLSVIDPEDATRWVAGILKSHGSRADWHARRLLGIGGSEMGAVVSFYRGEKSEGFSSVEEVTEGKLMKRLPGFETWHMRRGNVLEVLARQTFLDKVKGTIDHEAMNALSRASKLAGYEFMVGNPDDIVLIDGKRYIAEYKVPNTYSEEVEFDYEVQTHHYATLAKMAGIPIDGIYLVKLDLPSQMTKHLTDTISNMIPTQVAELARSINKVNLPGCRVVPLEMGINKSLQVELLAAGKDLWNDFVLKGRVPMTSVRELVTLDKPMELELARYQQQYMMAKSGIKHLESVVSQASSGIATVLKDVDFEGKKLPLSIVGVKRNGLDSKAMIDEALKRGAFEKELQGDKRTYSVSALLEEIERLGGNQDASNLYELAMESSKAEAFLRDRGANLESLRTPGLAIRQSTKKEDAEVAAIFRDAAAERFGAWIEESLISNQGEESDFSDAPLPVDQNLPIEMNTGHFDEAIAEAAAAFASQAETPNQIPKRAAYGLR